MILSIDLSLRGTGYCILNPKGLLEKYGVINTDNTETMFERSQYIIDTLNDLITINEVTSVVIENVAFGARGAMAYQLQGSHFATCLAIYNKHNIEVTALAITTVKKQFANNGRASKQDMLEAVPKDVRLLFEKDYVPSRNLYDLVDAYAVGIIYLKKGLPC